MKMYTSKYGGEGGMEHFQMKDYYRQHVWWLTRPNLLSLEQNNLQSTKIHDIVYILFWKLYKVYIWLLEVIQQR